MLPIGGNDVVDRRWIGVQIMADRDRAGPWVLQALGAANQKPQLPDHSLAPPESRAQSPQCRLSKSTPIPQETRLIPLPVAISGGLALVMVLLALG